MRRHIRGYWLVHWDGKDHYLGRDKEEAEKRYRQSLAEWLEWRKGREEQRQHVRRAQRLGHNMTVIDLAEEFLDAKLAQNGVETWRYYRRHLWRFVWTWAPTRLNMLKRRHIILLVQQMQSGYRRKDGTVRRYAAKTIRHDVTAIGTMLRWAMDLDYMPVIVLTGIKTPPIGPPPDKSLSVERVRELIASMDPEREGPWCAIQYLTGMRVSEVGKVVRSEGRWIGEGLFELDRGKMDLRTQQPRVIVFSDEALTWLARCKPIWGLYQSYSTAVRQAYGIQPSAFRHSAAKHLHHIHRVDRANVDLILGHTPSGVSVTYNPIAYEQLRALVARITLRTVAVSAQQNSSA